MSGSQDKRIDTPIGDQAADAAGSPVGVVRLDVEKSYAGIRELLKDYINDSNKGAWTKIKEKIDYTYECLELARHVLFGMSLYGEPYPEKIQFPSMYGMVFCHADNTLNEGRYVGKIENEPDAEGLERYVKDVAEGKVRPLDFTLCVPAGFDNLSGTVVPNVEVSSDPSRIFTASFAGGQQEWSMAKL